MRRGGQRPACPRRLIAGRSGGSRSTRPTGSSLRVPCITARYTGCLLADAEGACPPAGKPDRGSKAAEFRTGLGERGLTFALGVLPTQKVYAADVTLAHPERKATGRPRQHPVPSAASSAAAELIEARPEAFRTISPHHLAAPSRRTISWRTGTQDPLQAAFAAIRVRVADGPVAAGGQHLPGEEAWLIGEHRASGERKYYLANHPADTPLEVLAARIKAPSAGSCRPCLRQRIERAARDGSASRCTSR